MRRVVISDSSPLHYLILIGHVEILPSLYTEVLVPESVVKELQQVATPESVRSWIVHSPSWVRVVAFNAPVTPAVAVDLDPGERDAILEPRSHNSIPVSKNCRAVDRTSVDLPAILGKIFRL